MAEVRTEGLGRPEVDQKDMAVVPADTLTIPPGKDPVEYFYESGFTDGIPVVIPTRGRVAQMLLGCDRDPIECLGRMPPSFNPVTGEHVAISAVMAGAPLTAVASSGGCAGLVDGLLARPKSAEDLSRSC